MSSEGSRPDFDASVAEATPEVAQPPLFQVVLLNDDYTPMEFVVDVLERFFGMGRQKATQVMLEVHMRGKGVCGVFTFQIAETFSSLTVLENVQMALLSADRQVFSFFARAGEHRREDALALLARLHLWWRTFHDRRLWLDPQVTGGLTTTFGALLNSSGDQIWHLFIGPAGSISLLVLWGILRRAEGAHHLR